MTGKTIVWSKSTVELLAMHLKKTPEHPIYPTVTHTHTHTYVRFVSCIKLYINHSHVQIPVNTYRRAHTHTLA